MRNIWENFKHGIGTRNVIYKILYLIFIEIPPNHGFSLMTQNACYIRHSRTYHTEKEPTRM